MDWYARPGASGCPGNGKRHGWTGLDGAQARRCLLRQAKLFAVATRDSLGRTYTELGTSASRDTGRVTVPTTTAQYVATAWRLGQSPQRYLRTWTSAPSLRASPRLSYSHAPPVGRMPTASRARRNHQERDIM